jgi:cytochrome P450
VIGEKMAIPTYEEDIYSDQNILEPYECYREIRELGPVVKLTASNVLAISRYRDVKKLLLNHAHFISGKGVALTDAMNELGIGNTLMSDPPTHQRLRSVISAPLTPAAVEEMRTQIQSAADDLIDRLVSKESFDGVADLARFLPVTIVSRLIGLPEDGRENMLDWAAATFEVFGPHNSRLEDAFPELSEMLTYIVEKAGPDRVTPGSWAAKIHEAARDGLVEPERVHFLMADYLGPSLDTTIFATSYMLKLFGENP